MFDKIQQANFLSIRSANDVINIQMALDRNGNPPLMSEKGLLVSRTTVTICQSGYTQTER